MSWHYLREQGEGSSVECCSGGEPCAPLKSKTTHAGFYCNGKLTASYLDSLSGTTCAPLTADLGAGRSMSLAADFHVKTSAQPVKAQESTVNDQGFGGRWRELSVRYDRDLHSWKTHRCLWVEALQWSSVILPKWGMMRAGVLFQRRIVGHPIEETGSGLWQNFPTPTCGMVTGGQNPSNGGQAGLGWMARANKWPTPCASMADRGGRGDLVGHVRGTKGSRMSWPTPKTGGLKLRSKTHVLANPEEVRSMRSGNGGQLNPQWVELLMGWPPGWTSLDPIDAVAFVLWQVAAGHWPGTWEDGTPRVAEGVPCRVQRLKAIGNGQVPIVAATAWRILTEDL